MNFSAGLRSLCKSCSKKFGLSIWVSILIHWYEYTSEWNTLSFSNLATMIFCAMTFSNYTYTGKPFGGISSNGVNAHLIYFRSISDSNITEKNLMWLVGFRKNMKSCQIKGSLNSSCQKINLVFRSWRSC